MLVEIEQVAPFVVSGVAVQGQSPASGVSWTVALSLPVPLARSVIRRFVTWFSSPV